jgi:hypothetical protein
LKIPSGQGLWPAFWLLPDPATSPALPPEPTPWSDPNVYWPPEIDIMENRGRLPNIIDQTNIHSDDYPAPGSQANNWSVPWPGGYEIFEYQNGTDFSQGFHTYGLEWDDGLLVWYVDGVETHSTTNFVPPGSLTPGEMYIIANLAVGGQFDGGLMPSSSIMPKSLEIDYIRVYQKGSSPTHCTPLGDINCSSKVDIMDLSSFLSNFGSTNVTSDLNNNGKVDISDLSILLSNFGQTGSTPTATPTSIPVPTSTPAPTGTIQTVTFDTYSGGGELSGEYPTGVINWGTGIWSFDSNTWGGCTGSIWFTNTGATSAPFTFVTPKRLTSFTACNGGTSASTVTASCSGNSNATLSVPANSSRTITTNWTNSCSQVTLTSSNQADTNFDNFVIQ